MLDSPSLQRTLERRFGLRWSDERARDLQRFVARGRSGPDPSQDALDALLIGETFFFRYPFYLQLLLRLLGEGPPGTPFRVLSAACSSGEEAYSIAFTLAEPAAGRGRPLEVHATDVRRSAVEAARKAVYGSWSLRNATPLDRHRFFEPVAEGVRVREPWRSLPRFRVHNLLDPQPEGPFDAVVLPNATLYMHEEAVRAVHHNVAACLAPGGVLLLAPTDPVPGEGWCLHDEYVGWSVFSRGPARPRSVPRPVEVERGGPTPPARPRPGPAPAPVPGPEPAPEPTPPASGPDGGDHELWAAWAAGRLQAAGERIRQKVFYQPEEPLWRFLHGAVLWEGGWLRRAQREMETAARLLSPLPPEAMVQGLCTARELRQMVAFWSESHG